MAKASDNQFPKLIMVEGTAPATPAAGLQELFVDSADHQWKHKDSSGAVAVLGAGGYSAYSSYTPALTAATTNPTLGTGSTVLGQYAQDNKTVTGQFTITFGTSGVAAGTGQYAISLPVTADTSITSRILGAAMIYHSSTGDLRIGAVALDTSGTVKVYYPATNGLIGAVNPWTWAASDQIFGSFTYRAA